MPRNMSFALTTEQIRRRTKTVTRRKGWKFLKAGELLNACVKCQGLKPGEKIERLALLRVVDVSEDCLELITAADVEREGFPEMTASAFVAMFCRHMGGEPWQTVTRIEFEYVEEHAADV